MTLRTRLVFALVALAALGLVVFGVVTYQAYARSEYDRLDDRLRAITPLATGLMSEQAELGAPGPGGRNGGGDGGGSGWHGDSPVDLPPGTYAELRERTAR